jgi:hypothetical protein
MIYQAISLLQWKRGESKLGGIEDSMHFCRRNGERSHHFLAMLKESWDLISCIALKCD